MTALYFDSLLNSRSKYHRYTCICMNPPMTVYAGANYTNPRISRKKYPEEGDHFGTNFPETEFDFDATNHPQKSLLARSLRLVLGAVGRSEIPSPRTRRLRGLRTDGHMRTDRPRDIPTLVTCWVHNVFET